MRIHESYHKRLFNLIPGVPSKLTSDLYFKDSNSVPAYYSYVRCPFNLTILNVI